MKSFFKKVILILILLVPLGTIAQEKAKEKEGSKNKAPASSRVQRKAAKAKWKEQRKIERGQKKMVSEHHKRLQTKKTLKRMKDERKKSDRLRENKREFFLVRWFKYKH